MQVEVEPSEKIRHEYRHSLWIENGSEKVWPWVSGSAVIGARTIPRQGLKNGRYQARLFFAELEAPGRQLQISVQGSVVASDFSPSDKAGGPMRGVALNAPVVRVEDGAIRVQLSAKDGDTILNGLELVRVGDN